jgi:hypothetical protein
MLQMIRMCCECRIRPDRPMHRGANSAVVYCEDLVDGVLYALKFYAKGDLAELEEHVLSHKELALVLPPARHIEAKEHRTVLLGRVIVSREVQTLQQLLKQDPRLLRPSKHWVRYLMTTCDVTLFRGRTACLCFCDCGRILLHLFSHGLENVQD